MTDPIPSKCPGCASDVGVDVGVMDDGTCTRCGAQIVAEPEDATTIDLSAIGEEADPDELPVLPAEVGDIDPAGSEVLGAIEVTETDKDEGGVWSLALAANFAVQGMSVAEVDNRLAEGTYALVRVPEGDE